MNCAAMSNIVFELFREAFGFDMLVSSVRNSGKSDRRIFFYFLNFVIIFKGRKIKNVFTRIEIEINDSYIRNVIHITEVAKAISVCSAIILKNSVFVFIFKASFP